MKKFPGASTIFTSIVRVMKNESVGNNENLNGSGTTAI
jgi:hypothetical protein